MNINKEIYRKLFRLIPELDNLPISKEPFLIEKEGTVPLNVHILERQPGETMVNLCQYPRSESGELVPNPDVEIRLDHAKKEAVPTVYIDLHGRTELDEKCRKERRGEATQKDGELYSWLTALEKQGFKAVSQGRTVS